jgi:hypothetical protein
MDAGLIGNPSNSSSPDVCNPCVRPEKACISKLLPEEDAPIMAVTPPLFTNPDTFDKIAVPSSVDAIEKCWNASTVPWSTLRENEHDISATIHILCIRTRWIHPW